jgi:hypothetical protein
VANVDAFAIQRSDLNGFLFADVGVEANGMTLSVLSTLARLGMDPWDEAGRLARQPRSAAIDGLARMIAAMPSSLWPLPDSTAIAARLVPLLPPRGAGSVAPVLAQTANVTTLSKRLMERLPLGNKTATVRTPSPRSGPSVLMLALLATVLAGLTLYLIGQRQADAPDANIPAAEIQPAKPDLQSPAPPTPAGAVDAVPGAINKGP